MDAALIIRLLMAVAQLEPLIASQIRNIVDEINNNGLTDGVRASIHALCVSIHDQVVAAEQAKLAKL